MRLSVIPLLSMALFSTVLGGCTQGTGPGQRADSRAVISGRVVLEELVAGANDYSRVRVDFGRGEGGVAPDERGFFSVSDLEPDVYAVTVTYVGGLTAQASRSAYSPLARRVVARAGGSVDVGELLLELATAKVTGQVSMSGGSIPVGTEVVITPRNSRNKVPVRAPVALNGTYAAEGVRVGQHDITLSGGAVARPVADGCFAPLEVIQGEMDMEAQAFNAAPTSVGLSAGANETSSVQGSTWFLTQDRVTVKVDSAFATQVRTWTAGDPSMAAYAALPPDGLAITALPEGVTHLSLQFRDHCAFESPVYTLDLVHDTEAPVLFAPVLAGGAAAIESATTSLSVPASDATSVRMETRLQLCDVSPADVESCVPATPSAADWHPWTAQETVTFNATAGRKRVHVEVRDLVGNAAPAQSAETSLDLAPPSVSVTINGGMDLENAQSSLVVAHVVAQDDGDGSHVLVALADSPVDCAAADYLYPPSGDVVFALSTGQGERQVFACAVDAAGRRTASASPSNRVVVDSIPPAPPDVRLGLETDRPGFINRRQLDVAVSSAELKALKVLLFGDLAEAVPNTVLNAQTGTATVSVLLSAGDGPKGVAVQLVDDAGNVSAPTSRAVQLDTEPPGMPVVRINSLTEAERNALPASARPVRSALVSLGLEMTNADFMRVLPRTGATCPATQCTLTAAGFEPFAPLKAIVLSDGVGVKNLCIDLCDLALNGVTASTSVQLGDYLDRPQPVLTSLAPGTFAVQETARAVVATGSLIPRDALVQIADQLVPCASTATATCGVAETSGCATQCTFQVPVFLASRAGSYSVRLFTPDPVSAGLNLSQNNVALDVVAPVPIITRVSPRGITVNPQLADNAPENLVTVGVCGSNFINNTQFTLLSAAGNVVTRQGRTGGFAPAGCPDESNQYVEVVFPIRNAAARSTRDAMLRAVNPPPAGGESLVPFGLNPEELLCGSFGSCLFNLRATRTPNPTTSASHIVARPPATNPSGLYAWRGGSSVRFLDDQNRQVGRLTAQQSGGSLPLFFGFGPLKLDLEDGPGVGPQVALNVNPRRGDGTFENGTDLDFGAVVKAYAVGDLNGDGNLDLVGMSDATATLRVVLGTGTRVLSSTVYRVAIGLNAEAVEIADMNLDGNQDVLVVGQTGSGNARRGELLVYPGDGTGNLGDPFATTLNSGTVDGPVIRVRDLDRDGLPDVLVGLQTVGGVCPFNGQQVPQRQYHLLRNRLGAAPVLATVFTSCLGSGGSAFPGVDAEIADMDQDGIQDVVVAEGPKVTIYKGTRGFAFQGGSYSVPGNDPVGSIQAADLDGDGAPDLVVRGYNTGTSLFSNKTLRQAAAGMMVTADTTLSGFAEGAIRRSSAVADINGDGRPDLVLGGYSNGNDNTVTRLSLPNPSPQATLAQRFAGPVITPVNRGSANITFHDLDNDGVVDILVPEQMGPTFRVYFGRGAAGAQGYSNDTAPIDLNLGSGFSGPAQPMALLPAQWTRSAVTDLLVGCNGPKTQVLKQQADGTFVGMTTNIAATATPSTLTSGDFNLDGNPDVLDATYPNENPGYFRIYKGTGNAAAPLPTAGPVFPGTLASNPQLVITNAAVASMMTADVDADGFADAIAVDRTGGLIRTYRRFVMNSPVVEVSSGNMGAFRVARVADLNADGRLDLVGMGGDGLGTVTVGVAYGTGTGTFQDAVALAGPVPPMGDFPFSYIADLETIDLDVDGDVDVVAIVYSNSLVPSGLWVGRQDMPGMFTWSRAGNTSGTRLSAVDFSGDGVADVFSYATSIAAEVWSATSTGGVAGPSSLVVPTHSTRAPAVVTGINRDGLVDVASFSGSNVVHVDVSPGAADWGQELTSGLDATITVPGMGSTDTLTQVLRDKLKVRGAAQALEQVAILVRMTLGSVTLPNLDVVVTAPSGAQVSLQSACPLTTSGFAVGLHWSVTDCPAMGAFLGTQPTGDWTLKVVNRSTQPTQTVGITDFVVSTVGGIRRPAGGAVGGVAEPLVIPAGGGRVVEGSTLGFPDRSNGGNCGSMKTPAPAHVYAVRVAQADTFTVELEGDFLGAVAITPGTCSSASTQTPVLCAPSGPAAAPVSLTAGDHCAVVSSRNVTDMRMGTYRLHLRGSVARN